MLDGCPTPPLNTKSKSEHYREFLASFVNAVQIAGGDAGMALSDNPTLFEMADRLAQNGIRFTYDKSTKTKGS